MSEGQNPETKVIITNDEKNLVLDHNYDGIHELNHPLPNWWVGIWVICIVFSIPYFMYYHMAGGDGIRANFKKDLAQLKELKAAELSKLNVFDLDHYNSWVQANDGVAKGEQVFQENCLSCHAEGGAGDIGPNLADKNWIYAKDRIASEIFPIVRDGREDNGMPVWSEVLSKEDMYAAVAYIISLKGSSPANPKEAQGELIEK